MRTQAPDARDRAGEYIDDGYVVIPVPAKQKAPTLKDWTKLRLTREDVPEYFQPDSNIGALLGWNNLADVDLDCDEAVRIGAMLLPSTPATYGRPSRPASHRLYRLNNSLTSKRFVDPENGESIAEFRCVTNTGEPGLQSLLPGSVHPSGEGVQWTNGGLHQPAPADGATVLRIVGRIAAATLFSRYWPEKGYRHKAQLALIGALAHAGWTEEETFAFVYAVVANARTGDRERTAQVRRDTADTFRAHLSGSPTTGLPVLSGHFPKAVIDAVIAWLELPRRPQVTEWQELIPFSQYTPEQIPRPCLPGWLGDMAAAVAENTETPLELAGLLSYAVASACVAGRARLQIEPGYIEPLNIFVCAAMESGNRKTGVMTPLRRPLDEWEHDERLRLEPERKKRESERRTLELRIEKLQKDAAASKEPESYFDQIHEIEAKLPEIPAVPRLSADDITPEALALRMEENGGRMAVLSDEGGIFDILAGRYSNGAPNLDLFLKGHSGSPVRVDRVNKDRPPIILNNPCLTVGISPQPIVLAGLCRNEHFRGRGLLARFLYVLPASLLGYRTLAFRQIPPDVENRYSKGIRALLRLSSEKPLTLQLSGPAYSEWKEFTHALELEFRPNGKLDGISDWGGKLAGAAGRLAGVAHMIVRTEDNVDAISLETMRRALDLASVLISHARAAYALMDVDKDVEKAMKVVKWIIRSAKPSFDERECFRSHQSLFKRMDFMLPIMLLLEEHAYIRRVPQESTGGRKPSTLVMVNPAVFGR